MGGQNNLMWALLDKAKYKLMNIDVAPKSKIDAIIATLKNKFNTPANLEFNTIFGEAILADGIQFTGIKFDLSNESIYGTTYSLTNNGAAAQPAAAQPAAA